MSEQKLDRYKQKKSMREAAQKKSKMKSLLSRAFVAVFCLAFVFWLGYSIYLSVHGPIRSRTTVNAEAVTDYISGLSGTASSEAPVDGNDETTEETAEDTDQADETEETNETEDQSETEEQTTTESEAE